MSTCRTCASAPAPLTNNEELCNVSSTPMMVDLYNESCGDFDVVSKKCQIIKYNGNYHVSLVDNATGDPTLASNDNFSQAMTISEAIVFLVKRCGA